MNKYVPYIIIAVLLVLLGLSFFNENEVVVEKTVSDTVVVVKSDTVKVKIPRFIRETIIDTVYVEKSDNGECLIPISQRYYKDSIYEAWVSGYKPSLDSINITHKTINNIITNTVTKEIYPKTTDLYLTVGSDYINGTFAPNAGLSVKFKNDIVLGGRVGYYSKGFYYGVNVGYKLNK